MVHRARHFVPLLTRGHGRVRRRAWRLGLTLALWAALFGCGSEAPSPATAAALASCSADAECAIFDDGDPCTGVWACTAGACALDPTSVVTCDASGDTLCTVNRCDPATAACAQQPRNEGAACEDGDPCTEGDACVAGSCTPGKGDRCQCRTTADCASAEDGDLCNGTLLCDTTTFPYRCAVNPATVVVCPDGAGCKVASCDPKSGDCSAAPKADGAACDDGDPCTEGDACAAGSCEAGPNSCVCASDSDCQAKEDGDLCNGTLYCAQGKCVVNPATVVTCPTVDDTPCSKRQCQPATGLCAQTAVSQGKACDDGDACTTGEVCQGGLCSGGTDVCKCSQDADCAKVEDGNACNGTLFCNKGTGACEVNAATVVVCPAGNDTACKVNACDPKDGACALTPAELVKQTCTVKGETGPETCVTERLPAGVVGKAPLCDDGDPCTASDTCAKGVCVPGTQVCTCKVDADCLDKDDGDKCNGVPYCDKGTGTCKPNPATVVTCPTVDDTACLKRTCVPKTGQCPLKALENGALCDDGNACTKGDVCVFGQCNPGANTCECQSNSDCLSQDDGDLCNGVPYCDKSNPKAPKCKDNPASKVFCQASTSPCAVNACNPGNGLCQPQPAAEGKACDDGTVCTKSSACKGGACVGAGLLDCDDDNACTLDGCDPKLGCTHVKTNCADGNSCTLDACDAKTGKCSFPTKADGSGCDADQSGCTVADSCSGGVCKAGAPVVCQLPTGPCEQALCTAKGSDAYQCTVAAKADGDACDDGDACTLVAECAKGQCAAKSGNEGLFRLTVAPKNGSSGAFTAVMPVADGGFVLGGRTWSGTSEDKTWLMRVDAAGKALWEKNNTAKNGNSTGAVVALTPVAGAGVGVLRNTATGGAFDVVALDGKNVVLTLKLASHAGTLKVAGLGVLGDASTMVAGTRTKDGATAPWASRLTTLGATLWKHSFSTATDARVFGAGAVNGGLTAVGESGVGKAVRAWVGHVSAQGALLWHHALDGTSYGRLVSVAPGPDKGMVLVGTRAAVSKPRTVVFALNHDGTTRWSLATPNASFGLGGVYVGGALRTVGRSVSGPTSGDPLLVGADLLGNPMWTRSLPGKPLGEATTLIGLADDSVAVVGQVGDGAGKQRGLLWRVGAFGADTCKGQGKCAGKKVADCADNQACTADHCVADKGCLSLPSPGYTCDPGDGCHLDGLCVDNACKPTGRTLLFTRTSTSTADVARWTGGLAMVGGGWLVFGQRKDFDPVLERLDPTGEVLWSATWDDYQKYVTKVPTTVAAAVARSDGGALVASKRFVQGNNKELPVLRRISATGDVVWAYNADLKTAKLDGEPTDLAAVPGTEHSLLLTSKAGSLQLVRVDGAGKAVWTHYVDLSNQYGATVGEGTRPSVAAHPDGGAFIGVTRAPKVASGWPWRPMIRRVNALGGPQQNVGVWDAQFLDLGAAKLARVLRRSDGANLAVGWIPSPDETTSRLWALRFSDAGKPLWQREIRSTTQALNATLLPDGGVALLGTATTAAGTEALQVARLNGVGGLLWERSYAPAGLSGRAGVGQAIASDAVGNLLLAGEAMASASSSKPLLFRLDREGRASCAEAGSCGKVLAATASQGCDDKQPCTVDRCDPKAGKCTHTPAPEGLACGANSACVAGVCKAGKPGFVLVPKGSFVMGCNLANDPSCEKQENPNRTLSLPSFWMQRAEVTFGELQLCVNAGVCKATPYYKESKKDLPATHVSYAEAQIYCKHVGGRLPSEAEWAYAAKGSCALVDGVCAEGMPVQLRSKKWSACQWVNKVTKNPFAYGCGGTALRQGGQAGGDRSPFGLLDMQGNLGEYVADFHKDDAYKLDFSKFPFGPTSGPLRVVRGSTWLNDKTDAKVRLSRRRQGSAGGAETYGFRCVIP